MPPTLYLVRHAEGENNINDASHLRDPVLTPHGRAQALALRDALPSTTRFDAVMSSPLRRAIQTASLAFAPTIARRGITYTLIPDAQEANGHNCDIGHDPDELRALLPGLVGDTNTAGFEAGKIDTGLLHDGWNGKLGVYGISDEEVSARTARLRTWLFLRPERNIVLVTHGKLLHFLTEDWTGFDREKGTGWHNCEVRSYGFTAESTAGDAHLFKIREAGKKNSVQTG